MRILTVLLVAVVLCGCSKRPDDELAKAQSAYRRAMASEEFKKDDRRVRALTNLKDRAKAEIAGQDMRFALFRSYGRGRALCDSVVAFCNGRLEEVIDREW